MHLGIQQQKNVPNHYIVLDSRDTSVGFVATGTGLPCLNLLPPIVVTFWGCW